MKTESLKTKNCRCCDGTGREIDHGQMGQRMREARMRIPLTLTAVARRMKLSIAYVHDLECGKRYWTNDLLDLYQKSIAANFPNQKTKQNL